MYDYLFCATCGVRRTGHALRCSVCDSLLRRPRIAEPRHVIPNQLTTIVRWQDQPTPDPERQPIAA